MQTNSIVRVHFLHNRLIEQVAVPDAWRGLAEAVGAGVEEGGREDEGLGLAFAARFVLSVFFGGAGFDGSGVGRRVESEEAVQDVVDVE